MAIAAVRDEQLGRLLVAAVAGEPDRVASGQRLQIVQRVEQLLRTVGHGEVEVRRVQLRLVQVL